MLDERIVGRAGVHAYDPTRLVVDVRGLGATGHRVARLMREQDDINLELFSENVVVAVFGIGERAARTGERLVTALEHASERIGEEGAEPLPPFAEPPPWGPTELSPREAFLAGQEVVPFDEAEGRVAAESLAAYPPGVPNVLPGERLTRPTLDYIADSVAHGGLVRGASDRTLKTDQGGGARSSWGADSETGVLRHVLLGPPENFRWLPTSAISKATLESGASFDAELALSQHRELVSIYESAGVTVHSARARPGASLPGVRARLERDDAAGRRRHAAEAAVAPRRVRAGDPLLRGERDPDLRG